MENIEPNLCKHGHDKNVVGTLKSGFCRECGRIARRESWAKATDEQREKNRQYQRERYAEGLPATNVIKPLCAKGHVKAEVGVLKNGACRACVHEADKLKRENLTPEQLDNRREKNRRVTAKRVANTGITYRRQYHLHTEYGITVERYAEMLKEQNGVCAICKQPETRIRNGRLQELTVDHDHKTEVVRALLCSACNCAIGYMRDDPQLLIAAAEYLFSFQQVDQPASS